MIDTYMYLNISPTSYKLYDLYINQKSVASINMTDYQVNAQFN